MSIFSQLSHFLPDKLYLKIQFRRFIGRKLNLDSPQTFNEKLQWLKLYDRRPEYTTMVDKYAVKKYITDKIGKQYIIPTLGVWSNPDEIDFDKLPEQFVLKCTHNSGLGMCICRDKSKLNISKVKDELRKGLQQNYYLTGREWPYKNVPPRIIAEQYMEDSQTTDLRDYKLMCFNGKVQCSFVCTGRNTGKGLHVTFYDKDWNIMPFERHYPKDKEKLSPPKNYQKMIEIAEKLSENIPFVRVDFYEVKGEMYFGELTFYPGSGFEEFNPDEWDLIVGKMLKLPEKPNEKFMYNIQTKRGNSC